MRSFASFAVAVGVSVAALMGRPELPPEALKTQSNVAQLQAEIESQERQELEALKNGKVQEFGHFACAPFQNIAQQQNGTLACGERLQDHEKC